MTKRSTSTDLGQPNDKQSPWRLVITRLHESNIVYIDLHWGDKETPIHCWNTTYEELQTCIGPAFTKDTAP